MIYKISAMVNGEPITIEYDRNTSREQAKQAFRLLYPSARRLEVTEAMRTEEEEEARVKKVKAEKEAEVYYTR